MVRVLLQARSSGDKILKITKEQYEFLLFLLEEEIIDDSEFEFTNLAELKELSFVKE